MNLTRSGLAIFVLLSFVSSGKESEALKTSSNAHNKSCLSHQIQVLQQ